MTSRVPVRKPRSAPKPVRTIEVRRVVPTVRGDARARPCQWEVMIPLQFCRRPEAVTYARQMAEAANRLNPKVRTIVREVQDRTVRLEAALRLFGKHAKRCRFNPFLETRLSGCTCETFAALR